MSSRKRQRVEDLEEIKLTEEEKELFQLLRQVVVTSNVKTTIRVAGGWVRDKLMGKDSHDIDVAVDDMTGENFANLVNHYLENHGEKPLKVGVIQANPEQSKHLETAAINLLGISLDIVNLRSEEYQDSSRIPSIKFGTPLEDAKRRDFTINSLFYNINEQKVEDFTGLGVQDLHSKLIRTPLPPSQTFRDDPLRMLRAVRFASRFNFCLQDEVELALQDPENVNALNLKISRERIGNEVHNMFKGPSPELAIHLLAKFRLFPSVFSLMDYPPVANRRKGDSLSDEEIEQIRQESARRLREVDWDAAASVATKLCEAVRSDLFSSSSAIVEKELIPFAGLLHSLAGVQAVNAKEKLEPLPVLIIRDSLKLKGALAQGVRDVVAAVGEILELSQKLAQEPNMSDDELCLRTGRLLFTLGETFFIAMALASVLDPSSRTGLDTLFYKAKTEWGLDKVWEEALVFNGKELISALGFSKGGPFIGDLMAYQRDWIILHRRHGDLTSKKAELVQHLASLKDQVLQAEEERQLQARLIKEEEQRKRKEAKEKARKEKEERMERKKMEEKED